MHRSSVRRALGVAVSALGLVAGAQLALAPSSSAAAPAAPAATATAAHYVVVGPQSGSLARTEQSVEDAGGTVLQSWPQIGVVIASSTRTDFASAVRRMPAVSAAGASRALVERAPAEQTVALGDAETASVGTAATTSGNDAAEPLNGLQWDMRQIKADQAHEVSDGSRDVVVGVLDSGIDASHPDLAPNVDASLSVGCTSDGVPDTAPAAWAPTTSSHGTHVAGTIAAARNGIGVIGVAPDVRVASVKVVDDDGFIYPEFAICGFVWAGEHHFSATNNSYFIDPWYYWCKSDPDQSAVATAVRRAIDYAAGNDVVNVAALGNENRDLSKPIVDNGSPDNSSTPGTRTTAGDCRDMPVEINGVVGVSAVGAKGLKASYSNYGVHVTDVTAPGGDSTRYQPPAPPATSGLILSTLPGGGYGYKAGTSMATPHTVGVVALIRSTHPDWSAKQVTKALEQQADTMACPDVYDINSDGTPDAVCQGGQSGNGFYGAGLVDALDAVTH